MTDQVLLGYALDDLCRAVGVAGFLMYVFNYFALSTRLLTSEHTSYFVINIAAATMVLVSLSQDFNLASALIQGFWIIMGCVAVFLRLGWRRSRAACLEGVRP